ncbi:MAG: hypothetical protein AVDCRST_MAG65-1813, partial [uncultured Solirubrobacteraceae bacterium]
VDHHPPRGREDDDRRRDRRRDTGDRGQPGPRRHPGSAVGARVSRGDLARRQGREPRRRHRRPGQPAGGARRA